MKENVNKKRSKERNIQSISIRVKRSNYHSNSNGITLIALVITIIVLLILATVSIATLTGENGIIGKSEEAKEKNEIGQEKEIVTLAVADSKMNNSQNVLEENELQNALENYAKGQTEVSSAGKEFIVYFIYTNRFYTVDDEGNVAISNDIEIVTDPYPGDYTKNENGETLDGTINKPYEINCVEDLVAISNQAFKGENFYNKYIILNNSLNIESRLSYSDYNNTELFGDYNGDGITEGIKNELTNQNGCGFKPIEEFFGTFLGGKNAIKNLHMNTNDASNSTFAFIKENLGEVKELEISGNINYNVEQLTSTFNCIGGIIGLNNGKIKDSKSAIDINISVATSSKYVYAGGIAGAADDEAYIENCNNEGNITISSPSNSIDIRVGGIVGRLDGNSTVNNCTNNADKIHVETKGYLCIAGISCDVYNNSVVENCSNKSKLEGITGTDTNARIYMGGIISVMDKTTNEIVIQNCYNKGDLYANGYGPRIGGIVSSLVNNKILNCYNIGSIEVGEDSTGTSIGGIVGDATSYVEIKNSYNAGNFNLNGEIRYKGSILAYCVSGTIVNSYYINQENLGVAGNPNSISMTNVEPKTDEEMKSEEIITLLNQEGEIFKKDINNINRGYPILNI